jgi:hypothetical protein
MARASAFELGRAAEASTPTGSIMAEITETWPAPAAATIVFAGREETAATTELSGDVVTVAGRCFAAVASTVSFFDLEDREVRGFCVVSLVALAAGLAELHTLYSNGCKQLCHHLFAAGSGSKIGSHAGAAFDFFAYNSRQVHVIWKHRFACAFLVVSYR